MNKHLGLWIGLFLLLGLCYGCNGMSSPEETLYTNTDWAISFSYPSHWIIKQEGYQSIILSPPDEQEWQPQQPDDIAGDPFVTVRIGHAGTPATYSSELVDVDALRNWLTEYSTDGPNRELS